MGAILNTLPLNKTDNLSPNRADWLTSYADATGLAVVEIERLWNRFIQITGSHDQTKLRLDSNVLPNELSNDVFARNLLNHFPRSKTDGNAIPFGYFIIVMQWLDGANIQNKLAAIFFYLNNGEPITAPIISRLLKYIYPKMRDDEIKALAIQFMRQLGSTEEGQLNQQQFITGVQRFISPDELDELLHFNVMPPNLLEEANKLPSLQSSLTNIRNTNGIDGYGLVSDDQLRQIASQASQKNWSELALALGFLEYDIEAYKIQNNYDSAATIYAILQTWCEKQASLSTKNRLKNCLKQSELDELISILN